MASPEKEELFFYYTVGEQAPKPGTSFPWTEGIAGSVFSTGEPLVIQHVKQDKRHFGKIDQTTGFTTHDMIALPLKHWEGHTIGVLEVMNKKVGRLDQSDLDILTIIAAFTTLAIEQAHLFQEAKLADLARILGDIGQDMNNLLIPVRGSTSILKDELKAGWGTKFKPCSRKSCSRSMEEENWRENIHRFFRQCWPNLVWTPHPKHTLKSFPGKYSPTSITVLPCVSARDISYGILAVSSTSKSQSLPHSRITKPRENVLASANKPSATGMCTSKRISGMASGCSTRSPFHSSVAMRTPRGKSCWDTTSNDSSAPAPAKPSPNLFGRLRRLRLPLCLYPTHSKRKVKGTQHPSKKLGFRP